MDSEEIYQKYYSTLFFFILKRVKDEVATKDILQTTFLKIHEKKYQLKDRSKLKGWLFQITRNEIANYFNSRDSQPVEEPISETNVETPCCLDRFIDELPKLYQTPVQLVYLEGKSQQETANLLGISLASTKGRIRRAKEILKERFRICCKYQVNEKNQLVGKSDCEVCDN
ncbi:MULTISPECIES: sigma-70 family RNA polymerase sigma factor [Algoriphagus]|uniref:RNA polymerase sigma (SigZ) subunit n=1 Tax=Algoriphagus yeomjeoni TaxID=291403 RepID=A0A327P713_9BACT|nr:MULTISPECIES: sigma-70 family RNA polymerase sigma factor [Algoriphagus]RAI88049.1 RNA polymerase sigma (SigZ) subunit [Algoriphagus yeomjeoni]|tara:strand:+ start:799 stop:1311 length:513 start_codon:yes stop_codon:yes gene_type:complete